MSEYEFPSGREIGSLIGSEGVWLWHAGLTVMVIGAFAMLVWRLRRRASAWDIPVWIAALVAWWNLLIWIHRHVAGDVLDVLPYFLLLLLLITISAIAITAWRSIKPPALRNGIVFLIISGVAVIFILPAVQQAREAARRTQCKNNMKQIGLAIGNYVDTYGQYPFAGKVLSDAEQVCSWRVAIWPYAEAVPFMGVYHLEEPWNSPFNSRRLNNCPFYCQCPTHNGPRRFTDYSMLTGPNTIGGDGMTVLKLADILDGTSNTIFVVETSGHEILWTEPKDVEVTDASLGVNLPGDKPGHSRGIVSSYHVGGGHVVLADGTVRFVSEKIDKSVLKALTTINGGEKLPAEW
jgi:hypothetical protein